MSRTALLLAALVLLLAQTASGALTCTVSAVPTSVRSEGITERMGDIVLQCIGGAPSAPFTGALFAFLSVPVTNRISPAGTVDAVLIIDNGSGFPITDSIATLTGNGVGFIINTTLSPAGSIILTITNLRGAPAHQGVNSTAPIFAQLGFNGGLLFNQTTATVGVPARSLFASTTTAVVTCYGSPIPATPSMTSLIAAGARSFTMRVARGTGVGFEKRQANTDTGFRILLNYSGFPASARLFIPNVIAGSDATQPTGAGGLVVAPSGGAYTPTTSGSLLLARVQGADPNGAGGNPVYAPPIVGFPTVFYDSVYEIPLVNGAAQIVYEVMDANPNFAVHESAEIPTFLGVPQGSAPSTGGRLTISLAPLSTVLTATQTDPVPRFIAADVPSDCKVMGDCALFPRLQVSPTSLEFAADFHGPAQSKWLGVTNAGGGTLAWETSLQYSNVSGWASILANPWGDIEVRVDPSVLTPGVYDATLTVDAGPYAGVAAIPIRLTVTMPTTRIDSVAHGATYVIGPVAPGSIAMVKGTKLAGTNITAAFDGIPVTLLYASDTQINLVVPAALGSRASAQLIVTADGVATPPYTVPLVAVNPGIFPFGILNQDMTRNSGDNPADAGSIIAIFATGLSAPMSVRIAGRVITELEYAGPAPTLDGVQQINVRIPADLAHLIADVQVCGEMPGQTVCSPAVRAITK